MSLMGRELPFAAAALERRVSSPEVGEAHEQWVAGSRTRASDALNARCPALSSVVSKSTMARCPPPFAQTHRRRRSVCHRPSRKGTPAPRPVIRVRPSAPPTRRPRAPTRPRWPVGAKLPQKMTPLFPCQGVACGGVGGGLFRRQTGAMRASSASGEGVQRGPPALRGRVRV